MNWKLILSLSGLIPSIQLAYILGFPNKFITILGLTIYTVCVILIAKRAGQKLFLHGFMVGLISTIIEGLFLVALLSTDIPHYINVAEAYRKPLDVEELRIVLLIAMAGTAVIKGFVIGALSLLAAKVSLKSSNEFFMDQMPSVHARLSRLIKGMRA
jgi:uncharacterized membrane protein